MAPLSENPEWLLLERPLRQENSWLVAQRKLALSLPELTRCQPQNCDITGEHHYDITGEHHYNDHRTAKH